MNSMETTKIAIFRGKEIRKTIHKNEWWFVIVDVVAALTDSKQPDGYIKDMRRRDSELAKGWGQIATPLVVETEGRPEQKGNLWTIRSQCFGGKRFAEFLKGTNGCFPLWMSSQR